MMAAVGTGRTAAEPAAGVYRKVTVATAGAQADIEVAAVQSGTAGYNFEVAAGKVAGLAPGHIVAERTVAAWLGLGCKTVAAVQHLASEVLGQ